jgi:hypothetical protein
MYKLCTTLDKGLLNFSQTLNQSISNEFFLENYIIQKPTDSSDLEISKTYNLTNLFLENRWDNKCTLWDFKTKKTPTKAYGFNIVLPMSVENLDALDYEFYLISNSNNYRLRGNRTLETTFRFITREENLPIDGLLIKNKKTNKSYQFELVKE